MRNLPALHAALHPNEGIQQSVSPARGADSQPVSQQMLSPILPAVRAFYMRRRQSAWKLANALPRSARQGQGQWV